MTTPAPIEYTAYFAKGQAAYGTAATLANANAIHLQSATIEEAGARGIDRSGVMTGLGGAAPPIQGDRYFNVTITAEFFLPETVGDSSDWATGPLWEACPVTIADVAATSVTVSPKRTMVPMTDWVPLTFSAQTANGLKRTAEDVMLVPTKIDATGGSIIVVEFSGVGTWTADAAATLTAPAMPQGNLPLVATNGCLVDGIVSGDADFGFVLETGLEVKPLRDTCETYGWGIPMLSSEGPATLTYAALATAPYETARAAGATHNVVATFGAAVFNFPDAYILNIDRGETDGAQTYTVVMHLVRTASTPEWNIVMT